MSRFPVALGDDARDRLRSATHPDWIEPMRATLAHDHFSDPDWVFERKLDGERVIAYRDDERIRLLTRNRKDVTRTYPEVADALKRVGQRDFVVDGEVVAFDGNVTSFARLQRRMQIDDPEEARRRGIAVRYYMFDVMHLAGRDLRRLKLRTRKRILRAAFAFKGPLRFTPHRNADGEAYLKDACAKGWEGLIAKRADARYAGTRSRDWLKFKCTKGQELVIGGYTDPKGSRSGFGALLVGYYDEAGLRYAGKVGTGFDDDILADLRDRFDELARERSPFADDVDAKGAHWVAPKLVANIAFTEWTCDGRLRHPSFQGLRRDKAAKKVVRERPADTNGGGGE